MIWGGYAIVRKSRTKYLFLVLILFTILFSSNITHCSSVSSDKRTVITSTLKIPLSDIYDDPDYDIILFESFEKNVFPPDNWEMTIENHNYTWKIDCGNAYYGNNSLCCHHDLNKNPQNEWLITPNLDVSAYTEIFLSFNWFMSYFWSVYPYDNYDFNVYVSLYNETNWIKVWNEEMVGLFDNWIWYNTSMGESIDLSSYNDQNSIRIAFQYNGSDGAQLNVDDIYIFGRKITNPPIVNAGGPYDGYVGEPIDFYGNVSGGEPPYEWLWDFGNNNQSNQQNPVYSYNNIGNYSVKLTVTDSLEITDSDETQAYIRNMSKVPELIISNISGPVGIHAIICNKGCVDAMNVYWQIQISNLFIYNVTSGSSSCLKKKCCQQINSQIFSGFGIVNVNIYVDANNMDRISKRCKAAMLGKYIFPLS